eukprot:CAMPEP_0172804658 /NCGR_PEP_ID=MMETSP1075-20121228/5320_1 /TAXON_ID=2916 /ORGANISM="Ceratium fusus, Strain PA161109" /LENGTH=833 /DNA_ID=CAMNT_0013643275 /DNA_START=43 /DNA_END=2544 /DNA_ORIENTATION=+
MSRADNGMDPCRILGIAQDAVKSKEDLFRLKRRCKKLIEEYQIKRQGANARRVKWAFDQFKLKVCRSAAGPAPQQQPQHRPAEDSEAVSLSKQGGAATQQNHSPAERCEIIRNKAAARRERAGDEDPDDAKRRDAIREKLALKRMLKQVTTLNEPDGKQRVAKFLASSAQLAGSRAARVSLTCPISKQRMRIPARGLDCQHLQCFDLETFLWNKSSECPVCGLTLTLPAGLFVDGYAARILKVVAEKVQKVSFDPCGSWKTASSQDYLPAPAAALGEQRKRKHPETSQTAVPGSEALVTSGDPLPDTIARESSTPAADADQKEAPATAAAAAAIIADARNPNSDDRTSCPSMEANSGAAAVNGKKSAPEPACDAPQVKPPRPARVRPPREDDAQKQRVKRYHTLRPDELVDPLDEANYVAVDLPKRAMGIIFGPNPAAFGGAYIESFDENSAAARHGGLRVGDQLIGIGEAPMKGDDFDSCIDKLDMLVAKSREHVRLTVFRGAASVVYGKNGPSNEWLGTLMAKVKDGTIAVTPPLPEPEPPSPEPDPVPAQPEKKRRHRLSIPTSDESMGSSDDDSWLSGVDSASSETHVHAPRPLPSNVATCITGAGLDTDLQKCAEALQECTSDDQQWSSKEARAMGKAVVKACIHSNATEWSSHDDQAGWQRRSRKRITRAALDYADRLQSLEKQKQVSKQLAPLVPIPRQPNRIEEATKLITSGPPALLLVEPAKVIKFSRDRTAQLTLRNASTDYVAFRVRTSAAKLIFVQPCAGTLPQGGRIFLQICSSEHRSTVGDLKFLVQAVAATTGDPMPKESWCKLDTGAIQEWHLSGQL